MDQRIGEGHVSKSARTYRGRRGLKAAALVRPVSGSTTEMRSAVQGAGLRPRRRAERVNSLSVRWSVAMGSWFH
eukprot:6056604-Pleurochrysis_carterae.AAC.1